MTNSSKYAPLLEKLGIKVNDQGILEQAFVHRSYLNENRDYHFHNERLEFLGDAVLELAVTSYLFDHYPDKDEGALTNLRAALVRKESLATVANKLQLGDYLMLSRGEEASGGRKKDYILANTLEALIGYIYLDQGYSTIEKIIFEHIAIYATSILEQGLHIDSKSNFQEIAQEKIGVTPSYEVLEQSGPDHNRAFVVGAYIKEHLVGQGKGSSKKRAQDEAAKNALENRDKWLFKA